jgi:Fur family ferric uptake transcriptional regulator
MNSEELSGQNQKYRTTHQRTVILEEIRKLNTHPTADEVYEMVRKRLPRVSLGTVYRNLEILSTCGLIQKIGPVSTQMRFDGNPRNHYHVRCIYCGRVEDAPIETTDTIEQEVRAASDYTILGHRLEFIGMCPACRKKMNMIPQGNHEKGGRRNGSSSHRVHNQEW